MNFTPIHLHSITFMSIHLRSVTFMSTHPQSIALMTTYLHSINFAPTHLQTNTFVPTHLHSINLIQPHLHLQNGIVFTWTRSSQTLAPTACVQLLWVAWCLHFCAWRLLCNPDSCASMPLWGQRSVHKNHMLDRMGGMQIPIWNMWYPNEKKTTLDQTARGQMYKFVRDHGPRPSNCNQFMEWTDGQVHLPGEKLEGAVYPEKLCGMVPGWRVGQDVTDYAKARNHMGRMRKSFGSKTNRPSCSEGPDFFKAGALTKFTPAAFGDGMLQRMDASFLKAFLNPSTTQSHMQNKVFPCIFTCKAKEIPSCGLLST